MLPLVAAAAVGWGYQAPPPPLQLAGYQSRRPATQMIIQGPVATYETNMFTIAPPATYVVRRS